jgi:hypothetical protein
MGILSWIVKWFKKAPPPEESRLGVTFNLVGSDYQPPPKRPKRKLIQPDPICPYCGFKYDAFPKTKKKCPECGQIVIMKSKDKIKRLFTEQQADEYEEEKLERARINGLRGYLSAAGLDPHQLPLIHMNMEDETGHTIEYEDVVEILLEKAAEERRSSCDFDGAKWAYFELAHVRRNDDKEFFSAYREMKRMELMDYGKAGDVTHVQWSTGCQCDACVKHKDKVWTLNHAIKHVPYPSKKCNAKFPFCGSYVAYFPEE